MTEKQKSAKTIEGVAELLSDYAVNIYLTENASIELKFPVTGEEEHYRDITQPYREACYQINEGSKSTSNSKGWNSHYAKQRQIRHVIRSLAESPRFLRLTTVAHHMTTFKLINNEKENSPYGKMKCRKTKDTPFTVIFESQEKAEKFFEDLEKILSQK